MSMTRIIYTLKGGDTVVEWLLEHAADIALCFTLTDYTLRIGRWAINQILKMLSKNKSPSKRHRKRKKG